MLFQKSGALDRKKNLYVIFKGLNVIHLHTLHVNKNTHLTPNVVVTQEAAYLAHCQRPVRREDQIITHTRQQDISLISRS